MKKSATTSLIIAIIWFFVAFKFFSVHKIGVGLAWLAVGIINLFRAIKLYRLDFKVQSVNKQLEKTLSMDAEEKAPLQPQGSIQPIELSQEVHSISDEYTGYGYVVDKVFKPAKSHAAEVELLCTYAPDNEFGEEGDTPYIAVQTDDAVYCAVEEYKDNKTFDDATHIEPLEGKFLFRAKREYYNNMMYFYGFELENEEYWDKAGLCLVYPKEYVGTDNEEKLFYVLDEVAKSFKKEF